MRSIWIPAFLMLVCACDHKAKAFSSAKGENSSPFPMQTPPFIDAVPTPAAVQHDALICRNASPPSIGAREIGSLRMFYLYQNKNAQSAIQWALQYAPVQWVTAGGKGEIPPAQPVHVVGALEEIGESIFIYEISGRKLLAKVTALRKPSSTIYEGEAQMLDLGSKIPVVCTIVGR